MLLGEYAIKILGRTGNSVSSSHPLRRYVSYKYCVIGAGPAGLSGLGAIYDKLSESEKYFDGKQDILWVDKNFKGGAIPQKWSNVSSNTKVQLFLDFFNNSKCFEYNNESPLIELNKLDKDKCCKLGVVGKELQNTSNLMMSKVATKRGIASKFNYDGNSWEITIIDDQINFNKVKAETVIFATGADPISQPKNQNIEIPLQSALNLSEAKRQVEGGLDTVAIYGSSHSGMLVVRNFYLAGCKRIINFYENPILHAEYEKDWIRYDNTGLKGECSDWVREYIQTGKATNIERYCIKDQGFDEESILKTKTNDFQNENLRVVYAVGLRKQTQPDVVWYGKEIDSKNYFRFYDPITGLIGKNMFGLGIGFPEQVIDPEGRVELAVGMWDFSSYVNKIFGYQQQMAT